MSDEDHLEMIYEGLFSRIRCPECEEIFEVEGDVSNGEIVECEGCGKSAGVTGR